MGRDYYGILGVDKKASQDGHHQGLEVEKLTVVLGKGLSDFFLGKKDYFRIPSGGNL